MGNIQNSCDKRKMIVTHVWSSLLDAELNFRYWDHLCRRYYLIDRYAKVFLAVMSSSTVAGWGFWRDMEILWKILYGISVVTALALPIFDFRGRMQIMSKVGERWWQILSQYENLVFDIRNGANSDKIAKQYKLIRDKRPSNMGSVLPSNKKRLKNKLYDEIVKSRYPEKEENYG